jgi:hypothetical protein
MPQYRDDARTESGGAKTSRPVGGFRHEILKKVLYC